tara:strand:+ start:1035 stop:1220 length:186 start_codon:yes stop_codon:yes gene_type:complete
MKKGKCGKVSHCTTISRGKTFSAEMDCFILFDCQDGVNFRSQVFIEELFQTSLGKTINIFV